MPQVISQPFVPLKRYCDVARGSIPVATRTRDRGSGVAGSIVCATAAVRPARTLLVGRRLTHGPRRVKPLHPGHLTPRAIWAWSSPAASRST